VQSHTNSQPGNDKREGRAFQWGSAFGRQRLAHRGMHCSHTIEESIKDLVSRPISESDELCDKQVS